jgi:type VI secretion system secreted protein Hcp
VIAPFDASSGLPSGKRQHKPIDLTMAADLSSVRLLKASLTNENLPSVGLNFVQKGETSPYLQITLQNVRIVSYSQFTESGQEYDQVQFVYQTITVTWVSPEFIVQDSWSAPDV